MRDDELIHIPFSLNLSKMFSALMDADRKAEETKHNWLMIVLFLFAV